MIEHIWSVLSSSASIDRDNNHVSLFDVIENLNIHGTQEEITRIPIRMQIISLWTKYDQKASISGKVRYQFIFPDGESRTLPDLPITLNENIFHHTRLYIQGMELRGPGIYKFKVELNEEDSDIWKIVSTLPINIKFLNKNEEQKSDEVIDSKDK